MKVLEWVGCWVRNVPGTFYVRESTMRPILSLHKTATLLKTRRFWMGKGAAAYEGSFAGKMWRCAPNHRLVVPRLSLYKCLPVRRNIYVLYRENPRTNKAALEEGRRSQFGSSYVHRNKKTTCSLLSLWSLDLAVHQQKKHEWTKYGIESAMSHKFLSFKAGIDSSSPAYSCLKCVDK